MARDDAARGHFVGDVLGDTEELPRVTGGPPPHPGHAPAAEKASAGLADVVDVFRVDDNGNPGGAGGRAGVEECPDLVSVQDVRAQDLEDRFDLAGGPQPYPGLLADADEACPQGFDLGGQGSRALEAQHRHLLAKPAALADEIDHDAFQPARIQGQDGVGNVNGGRQGPVS